MRSTFLFALGVLIFASGLLLVLLFTDKNIFFNLGFSMKKFVGRVKFLYLYCQLVLVHYIGN